MKYSILFALILMLGALGCTKSANTNPSGDSKKGSDVMVEMETSKGTIKIKLDSEKAPETVKNFLSYVNDGFYSGTVFHRVIDGFMIQGGGFAAGMEKKETKAPVKNEASNGLSNKAMTIAMARTNDPDSATSQFFINLVDNGRLDYVAGQSDGYTVFGEVVEGQDVVKAIGKVETGNMGYYQNVPKEAVVINKVTISE